MLIPELTYQQHLWICCQWRLSICCTGDSRSQVGGTCPRSSKYYLFGTKGFQQERNPRWKFRSDCTDIGNGYTKFDPPNLEASYSHCNSILSHIPVTSIYDSQLSQLSSDVHGFKHLAYVYYFRKYIICYSRYIICRFSFEHCRQSCDCDVVLHFVQARYKLQQLTCAIAWGWYFYFLYVSCVKLLVRDLIWFFTRAASRLQQEFFFTKSHI